MKRVLVTALITLVALAVAAPASAADPTLKSLARQVKALQKEVKTLKTQVTQARTVAATALVYAGCSTAVTADALQGTWTFLDQKHATGFGPRNAGQRLPDVPATADHARADAGAAEHVRFQLPAGPLQDVAVCADGLDQLEPLREREERAREGRMLGAPAHVVPVHLLPDRTGHLDERVEVELVLSQSRRSLETSTSPGETILTLMAITSSSSPRASMSSVTGFSVGRKIRSTSTPFSS